MRLADKIATMARRGAPLPYDYAVEYIQSAGVAYAAIPMTDFFIAEFVIQQVPFSSEIRYYCGFGGSNDGQYWGFQYGRYSIGSTPSSFATGNKDVVRWVTSSTADNYRLFVNGEDTGLRPSRSAKPTNKLYLCSLTALTMSMKLWSVKIWNESGTEMLFDLIPVVKDGVVGLFDNVNLGFYPSVVSTQFTAGPRIDISALSSTRGGC